jgi:hypothetical protein
VFDEMPMRTVLKDARVLLLGEASRMQDAVGRMLRRCAGQRLCRCGTTRPARRGSSR